jgi:hypothetical protein
MSFDRSMFDCILAKRKIHEAQHAGVAFLKKRRQKGCEKILNMYRERND